MTDVLIAPPGVEVIGPPGLHADELLTAEALAFVLGTGANLAVLAVPSVRNLAPSVYPDCLP